MRFLKIIQFLGKNNSADLPVIKYLSNVVLKKPLNILGSSCGQGFNGYALQPSHMLVVVGVRSGALLCTTQSAASKNTSYVDDGTVFTPFFFQLTEPEKYVSSNAIA